MKNTSVVVVVVVVVVFVNILSVKAINVQGSTNCYRDSISITEKIRKLDALLKHRVDVVVIIKNSRQEFIVVDDLNNWPKDIETVFNYVCDSTSGTLLIKEIPSSESGDWYIENNFYFDSLGQILANKYFTSMFNGICESLIREYKSVYYSCSLDTMLTTYLLKDKDNNVINNPKECVINHKNPFPYVCEITMMNSYSKYLEVRD